MDGKYIVFKREDFFQLMGELGLPPWDDGKGEPVGGELDCAVLSENITKRCDEVALDDAVVIRRQDVFAPPALDAYANSIRAAIEVQNAQGTFSSTQAKLQEIADYFHEQAAIAWDTNRKLPD